MKAVNRLLLPIIITVIGFGNGCQSKTDFIHYHLNGLYIGNVDTLRSYDTLSLKNLRQRFECGFVSKHSSLNCESTSELYDKILRFDSLNMITKEVIISENDYLFRSLYFDDEDLIWAIELKSESPEQDLYLREDKDVRYFQEFIAKDTVLIFSKIFYPKIGIR